MTVALENLWENFVTSTKKIYCLQTMTMQRAIGNFFRLDRQTVAAVLSHLIGNSANAVFML